MEKGILNFRISGMFMDNLRMKKDEYERFLEFLKNDVVYNSLKITNAYDVSCYEHFIKEKESNYIILIVSFKFGVFFENYMTLVMDHIDECMTGTIRRNNEN